MARPEAPCIYEVHTRQWLHALSQTAGTRIDLHTVPDGVIDRLATRGVSHLWLMGVWPSGPRARWEAQHAPGLLRAYDEAVPDWTSDDVVGSPYAVSAYTVANDLGGEEGLAHVRARLATRGIRTLLDFIPNHVGIDHPWLATRPDLFVGAPTAFPGSFALTHHGGTWHIAHGADPFFPPWTDTAQLDHRKPETWEALTDVLLALAQRCDGVRCDMAMLVLEDVFAHTWRHTTPRGAAAPGDLWTTAIPRVKSAHPDFLWIAEAYWNLEDRLCALGFDAAYDKTLYDLLVHGDAQTIASHLNGLGHRHTQRVHFLENHDERRAASSIPPERHRAAALLTLALPGLRFLHDGQLEGLKRPTRVQLARRAHAPHDVEDPHLVALYDEILSAIASSGVGRGEGCLLRPQPAWSDNPSHAGFVLVQWHDAAQRQVFDLMVVNLAEHRAQCRAPLDVPELAAHQWLLTDLLGRERWLRDGTALKREGLFLDVPGHGAQLFRCTAMSAYAGHLG